MDDAVLLHVGLHKTATTFLQSRVFPQFDPAVVAFNPPELFETLRSGVMADVVAARARARDDRLVLLSKESMAGTGLHGYADHAERTTWLAEAFPGATVALILRFQPDWLASMYRQALQDDHYLSVEAFLNWNGRSFGARRPDGSANLDALGLDYAGMIRRYRTAFGGRVRVFFHEDLRSDPDGVIGALARLAGCAPPALVPAAGDPNRSYSALACQLTLARARLLTKVGLGGLLLRPGTRRRHRWCKGPLKGLRWRYLMQNQLDRLYYLDWDLIASQRALLISHYQKVNRELSQLVDHVPDVYLGRVQD